MLRSVHGPIDSHFTVYRPAAAAARDVLDSLLALKKPALEGFRPNADTTHVSTFFADAGTGVINVTYTSQLRRLLCYSARFENGDLAAILLAGHSVRQSRADGTLQDAILKILEATSYRGAIIEHRVTSVAPPDAWSLRRDNLGRFFAVKDLGIAVLESAPVWKEPLPPVGFNKVHLAGWFTSSFRIPSCTFTTSPDARDLLLGVRWGGRVEDMEVINLTRPKESARTSAMFVR